MEFDILTITSSSKDGSEVVRKTGVVMIVKDSAKRAYFLKVTFVGREVEYNNLLVNFWQEAISEHLAGLSKKLLKPADRSRVDQQVFL